MAINLNGYSTSRITSLYSGMDTQSLVNNMMQLEQLKVDKIYQQREKAIWKNEAYTELNTQVTNLKNSFLSVLGDNSLLKSGVYNAFKVNMAQNSALNITATSNATASSFSISDVQMATTAKLTGKANSREVGMATAQNSFIHATATSTKNTGMALTDTIGDHASRFGLSAGDQLSFSINGETFSFGQDAKIEDVLKKVNASEAANVNMELKDGKFTLTSKTIGTDTKLQLSDIKGKAFSGGDNGFSIKSGDVKRESAVSSTTTLAQLEEMGFKLTNPGSPNSAKFSINGENFEFDLDTELGDLLDEVNNSNADVKLSYNEQTASFRITNTNPNNDSIAISGSFFSDGVFQTGGQNEITATDAIKRTDTLATAAEKLGKEIGDKLEISINGKKFSFDTKTTSLNDMMSKINNDADAKATFAFNEMTDTFTLESLDTGKSGTLHGVTGLDVFGIELQAGSVVRGANAKITLSDGETIEQGSNTFELDGMRFEITGNFTAESTKDNINVNVTRNYDTTVDAVKGFVEEYNKLVETMNGYYTGKVERKYQPLTEAQREEMSEKEQELWDEKAKSGILRNDPALGSLLSSLRTQLFAKVEGTGMSAADLGLSTVSWNSTSWKTDQGKIQLDETKLRAALEENPNAVQDVLTKIGYDEKGNVDASIDNTGTSKSGLFTAFSEYFTSFNSKMRNQNIKQTQESVDSYTNRISDMLTKMADKEEKYYLQYSQMETMLAKMQSQSDWLTAQLGMSSK